MTKQYFFDTKISTTEILDKLNRISIEKQPFTKPKGILFLGKINKTSFQLITFHAPPMKFKFTIENNKVYFTYRKDDLTKTFKSLIYAILIPTFIILWIIGMFSPSHSIIEKWLLTINLGIPFLLNMIVKYVYNKYILVNDIKILKRIENTMGISIVENPNLN